jgi:hypothetical protein
MFNNVYEVAVIFHRHFYFRVSGKYGSLLTGVDKLANRDVDAFKPGCDYLSHSAKINKNNTDFQNHY